MVGVAIASNVLFAGRIRKWFAVEEAVRLWHTSRRTHAPSKSIQEREDDGLSRTDGRLIMAMHKIPSAL